MPGRSLRLRTAAGWIALAGGMLAIGTCGSPSAPGSVPPLLPLATGNYWVYVDSAFDHGALVRVLTDTCRVTGTDSAFGGLWWQIRRRTHGMQEIGSQVQLRGDGLYAIMFGYPGRYYQTRTFLAPRDTAFGYGILFEGDILLYRTVRVLPGRVTVPAGAFANCAEYEDGIATNILAPGVGVLRRTSEDTFDSTRTTSTLVTFGLR